MIFTTKVQRVQPVELSLASMYSGFPRGSLVRAKRASAEALSQSLTVWQRRVGLTFLRMRSMKAGPLASMMASHLEVMSFLPNLQREGRVY